MIKICALVLILTSAFGFSHLSADETKEQRDARMGWWRDARFGLFINWGLYSVPAGEWHGVIDEWSSEWLLARQKIPIADYKALVSQFNPTDFNAEAWVSLAKAAGTKYIIYDAKHHDGFAMFKSAADPFNIYDATPFKRDPLKELAAACRKHGMRLGFYYSQAQDWTAPGGAYLFGPHWDKAQDGDFDAYLNKKALPQLEELLTNYPPYPDVLWFDTPANMTPERAAKIVALMKQHPNLIWNNRLGGGVPGDTETPEQTIPPGGFPGRDWESCMTINDSWGFKTSDKNWKSTQVLLRDLVDIASKGGNYLLNVGPDSKGNIPAPEADRLREMGKWLAVNGDSIYGTQPGPFIEQPTWGRVTEKPGKLYLHVFNWPVDGKLSIPFASPVKRAYLLAQRREMVPLARTPQGLTLQLPQTAVDPNDSVVVLEFTGSPLVVLPQVQQDANGSLVLGADDAQIVGELVPEGYPKDLGNWGNDNDYPHWTVRVKKPGLYKVQVNYALQGGTQGSSMTLSVGTESLTFSTPSTSSWSNFKQIDVGTIKVDKEGLNDFILRGKRLDSPAVGNLRGVTLTPIH